MLWISLFLQSHLCWRAFLYLQEPKFPNFYLYLLHVINLEQSFLAKKTHKNNWTLSRHIFVTHPSALLFFSKIFVLFFVAWICIWKAITRGICFFCARCWNFSHNMFFLKHPWKMERKKGNKEAPFYEKKLFVFSRKYIALEKKTASLSSNLLCCAHLIWLY